MITDQKKSIRSAIAQLQCGESIYGPRDAEALLMEALNPLLREAGYDVKKSNHNGGFDFLAVKQGSADYQHQTLGIDFKYYPKGRSIGIDQVRTAIGSAVGCQNES